MPRLLAPHKSSLHRQACLSLYKALLRESTLVGTATSSTTIADTLKSLIRHRFRKDQGILSQAQVGNGIRAATGFLGLLRKCAATEDAALETLSSTLETVSSQAAATATYRDSLAARWKPPHPSRHAHLRNLRQISSPRSHVSGSSSSGASDSTPRIFTHPAPLSSVKSGVRKVPNLILAQGIPLLKYPGPTPVIVNRVLKEKILWGVRKWEQHKAIQRTMRIAEWEDEWDGILATRERVVEDDGALDAEGDEGSRSLNVRVPGTRVRFYDPRSVATKEQGDEASGVRSSWTTQLRQVDRSLELGVLERGKRYAVLGDRYWHEVVVKERELKEQERKEKKHQRRMARKQADGTLGAERDIPAAELQPSSVASGFI